MRRRVFATVPVTVEYSLTPLGESLGQAIESLRAWAYANAEAMNDVRAAYQQQQQP